MKTYLAILALAFAGCQTFTPAEIAAMTPEQRAAYVQAKLDRQNAQQARLGNAEDTLLSVGKLYLDSKTNRLLVDPKKAGTAK